MGFVIGKVSRPYVNFPRAIREMARVLRPNGEIWITLHPFKRVLDHMFQSFQKGLWKDVIFRTYVMVNGIALHFGGFTFPFPVNHRTESFQTCRGVRRILRKSGFTDIRISKEDYILVMAKKPSAETR